MASLVVRPKRKRHSWSRNEKLAVIEYSKQHNVQEASDKFGCDKSQISRWMSLLDESDDFLNDSHGLNRRNNNNASVVNEQVERAIFDNFIKCRRKKIAVTGVSLQEFGKTYATDNKIAIACSNGWLDNFKQRHNLVTRHKTKSSHLVPDAKDALVEKFVSDFEYLVTQNFIFERSRILNMDETPLCLDMPYKSTLEIKGAKTVTIQTEKREDSRFTTVLAVTSSGIGLPPMVIFRGKKSTLPKAVIVPPNIVAINQQKAWMDEKTMIFWIKNVLKVWRDSTFGTDDVKFCILTLDSYKAHKTDAIVNELLEIYFIPLFIPGGLTPYLQPLDVSVNRSFKSKIRKAWNLKKSQETGVSKTTVSMSKTKILNVISDIWPTVEKTLIQKAFDASHLDYSFMNVELFGVSISPIKM